MAAGSIAVGRRAPARPFSQTVIGSWLTTTDHKRIGLLYMFTAFTFFMLGGLEAELIRTQLAAANLQVLNPTAYDQVFTMHGTTMIFLFVMPMTTGLGNFVVPLMIGAKDMAFPRLNAFGYWMVALGGLFMYSSFVLGAAPNAGWFSYAPLTECTPMSLGATTTAQATAAAAANAAASGATIPCFAPGPNMDFWIIGVNLLGI